jgi:hypothetical protein
LRYHPIAIPLLASLAWCGSPDKHRVDMEHVGRGPSALAGEHPVPISGHYEAMITSATPESDGLHVTDVGEGDATHLGRLTSKEHGVIHPDGSVQGMVVLTAAKGDQLFWSDVGRFTGSHRFRRYRQDYEPQPRLWRQGEHLPHHGFGAVREGHSPLLKRIQKKQAAGEALRPSNDFTGPASSGRLVCTPVRCY